MPKEINIISVLEGRVATYSMLSRLYRDEIDEATLAELMKMRCPLNTGNADVDAGYRLFHAYLSNAWERTLEDLARDYLRTFVGANTTGHSAAYPNESVHTSPERLLMQDARDEILVLYRAAGLKSDERWKRGEDHIAVELEYMLVLSQRALTAVKKGDIETASRELMSQYHFIVDHLQGWIPFLTKDMLQFAQTDFYKALAYLTRGYVEVDKEFLENILSEEIEAERVA
jgi:TorA maturation chaperone TorD